MGIQIEITEQRSVIVVTLSGATGVTALAPLTEALLAAASEGRSIIIDINNLRDIDTSSLAELIDLLGLAPVQLKVVSERTGSEQRWAALSQIDTDPSVAAALDEIVSSPPPTRARDDMSDRESQHQVRDARKPVPRDDSALPRPPVGSSGDGSSPGPDADLTQRGRAPTSQDIRSSGALPRSPNRPRLGSGRVPGYRSL